MVKHTLRQIRALKEKLAQLPPVEIEAQELTTLEALKMLRPEVTALQRKGYSLDMIAKVLEANGFTVTATTLKRYRHAKKSASVHKIEKKNTGETAQAPQKNTANHAKPRTPSSAGATRLRQPGSSESDTPGAGGFTPREDTRDI